MTSRRWPLVALAVVATVSVLGCGRAGEEARPTPDPPATLTYQCEDGVRFHALVEGREARLLLPDRTVRAALVPSASGARFEGSGVVYWSKGGEALLEVGEGRHSGCEVVDPESAWAKAALRGVVFRALGQEPGWLVDVDSDGSLRVEADYGQRQLTFPQSETRSADGVTVVTARHDGHSTTLRIRPESCSDAMSGFRFPATVQLALDGERLSGCGRSLDPGFPG